MHNLNIDSEEQLSPTYAGRSFSHDIPKYRLPGRRASRPRPPTSWCMTS